MKNEFFDLSDIKKQKKKLQTENSYLEELRIFSIHSFVNKNNNKEFLFMCEDSDDISNKNTFVKYKKFYEALDQCNINSFDHQLIKQYLTYSQSKRFLIYLIEKRKTIENGYNEKIDLDRLNQIPDFKIFNRTKEKSKDCNENEPFVKIPNVFIQTSLEKNFRISSYLLPVYVTIAFHKNIMNRSMFTIGNIMENLNLDKKSNRTKSFEEILTSIRFLIANDYIECKDFDNKKIKVDTPIDVGIITDSFYPDSNFTILTLSEYNKIKSIKYTTGKPYNVLFVYLYVKSHIRFYSNDKNNNDGIPKVFYKSITSASCEIDISKPTFTNILNVLSTGEYAMLLKYDSNKINLNFPNLYTLNDPSLKNEFKKFFIWYSNKFLED